MSERLKDYLSKIEREGDLLLFASEDEDVVECNIRFAVIRLLVDLCLEELDS